ncbi:hypothetical protein GJAV_G00214580, partial [Gymnothorax javanicus]
VLPQVLEVEQTQKLCSWLPYLFKFSQLFIFHSVNCSELKCIGKENVGKKNSSI